MKVHSLEMNGSFLIEKIRRRDIWKNDDSGRLIYEKDSNLYWLGGFNDWVSFNLIEDVVKFNHLDIGIQSISAEDIPCEFNGIISTIQDSILNLASRNINQDLSIVEHSITKYGFNVDASDLKINDDIINLVSNGDLLLYYDSTSSLSIHDKLIINSNILNSLNSNNILLRDSTSNIQLSIDELFSSQPHVGNLHQLYDFYDWDCSSISITEYYLGTTGTQTTWKCIDSNLLLLNIIPSNIIPDKYLNFQQYLNSCGEDFKVCHPYIITDILIIDDIIDYQLLYLTYHKHHTSKDPNLIYDFLNNKVLIFYNGEWIDADCDCYEMKDLINNRIYIVPITNTMFYIDCDGNLLKIFDRKRI